MKKMQRTRARYVANRYSMNCKLLLGKLDDTQYIAKYSSPQAYEAGGRGGRPPPRVWKISGQLWQAQVAQKSWMTKIISIHWKSPGQLCFLGQAQIVKNPEYKKYIQYSENFQGNCFFRASASCSKIVNGEKFFNTVYIHLGMIRVIWASVVCNLDQSRDWL